MPNSIIIIRQHSDALKTAKILAKHGCESFIEPAFTVKVIVDNLQQLIDLAPHHYAVIITSKNAIQAIEKFHNFITNNKFIILGKASCALAKKLGFNNIEFAGSNIHQLQQYLTKNYHAMNFLYASGLNITAELNFENCNNNITRMVVYKTIATPLLSDEFKEKLVSNEFAAIMFFSAKTALMWHQLLQQQSLAQYTKNLTAFCLSDTIAKCVASYGFKATITAKKPNLASIIKLVAKYRFI